VIICPAIVLLQADIGVTDVCFDLGTQMGQLLSIDYIGISTDAL
jgi:hypothetical protein